MLLSAGNWKRLGPSPPGEAGRCMSRGLPPKTPYSLGLQTALSGGTSDRAAGRAPPAGPGPAARRLGAGGPPQRPPRDRPALPPSRPARRGAEERQPERGGEARRARPPLPGAGSRRPTTRGPSLASFAACFLLHLKLSGENPGSGPRLPQPRAEPARQKRPPVPAGSSGEALGESGSQVVPFLP